MNPDLQKKAKEYIIWNRRKGMWSRLVQALCCIVVFCTTYALILPVITQEQDVFCGYAEHTHGDSCYAQAVSSVVPVCSYASLNVHVHCADCYDLDGRVLCAQADYLVHTHATECFGAEGQLICALPEAAQHAHGDSCYIHHTGHTHDEDCYVYQRGNLVCTQPESVSHTHGEECYALGETLLCGIAENHIHGEDCYAIDENPVCGIEVHDHDDGCYAEELVCAEEHDHTSECFVLRLTCSADEHSHGSSCCPVPVLSCTEAENHIHNSDCHEIILACGLEESAGHLHGDECYESVSALVCGLEEKADSSELVCTEPEAQIHAHSEACFKHDSEAALSCELPEHEHSLICYSDPNADHETEEDWERSFAEIEFSGVWAEDVLAIAETQLGYRESTRNYIVDDDGETIKGYTRYGDWYGADHDDWCAMFASFCIYYADVQGMPLEADCEEWIRKLSSAGRYQEADAYEPMPGDLVFFDCDDDGLSDHVGIVETAEPLTTIEGNSGNRVQRVDCASMDREILGYGLLPQNPEADAAESGVCYDEDGNPIYIQTGTSEEENTIEEESASAEQSTEETAISESVRTLICADPEHAHGDSCYEVPAYLCGQTVHVHNEACFDENAVLICTAAEHSHEEGCLTAPAEENTEETPEEEILEEEALVQEDGRTLICADPEHAHDDSCYEVPAYLCGLTAHAHEEACYDENAALICTVEEHSHEEGCLTAPAEENTEETPEEEILEEEAPVQEDGRTLICADPEHAHDDSCYEVPAYLCGQTVHVHNEACFDENAVLICTAAEHSHEEGCLTAPAEENTEETPEEEILEEEAPVQKDGRTLICADPEHAHDDSCYEVPAYLCGLTAHAHEEACYDENATLICTVEEHSHEEGCLTAPVVETPVYYCGMDVHTHAEECYDENAVLICTVAEHSHDDVCLTEPVVETPVYYCGVEEHIHAGECYDENAALICTVAEHSHDDVCLTEPVVETPVYYCGMDVHMHAEECIDETGAIICTIAEHIHNEICLTEPVVETPVYYCGMEAHTHAGECCDESGILACALIEHVHDESCLLTPVYYCGMEAHTHTAECCDESGILSCTITEHVHNEICLIAPVYTCGVEAHAHTETCFDESGVLICAVPEHAHDEICLEGSGYFCGTTEHSHSIECVDDAGWRSCGMEEHSHTIACTVDLRNLNDDMRRQVREVILLIEGLYSADEIDMRIMEYENIGDYEGEEAWLSTVYPQVSSVYMRYARLTDEAQALVVNRDKLLEMEYIWSLSILYDTVIASTIDYSSDMFTENSIFVVYTEVNGAYYAFDGNGNAVPLAIDADGTITADVTSKYELLWSFANAGSNSYLIKNVSTGRYMHAYPNNGSGVTTSGAYSSTLIESGGGIRIRSNSEYARLNNTHDAFVMTQNQNAAAVYQFGVIQENYVWLDGTDGGLAGLAGSPNESVAVELGNSFTLPETWESPTRYSYALRGWYDVKNGIYYKPGDSVTVTENLVFYADWVAATYNIGEFNKYVVDTQSTDEFITVRMFDYNALFNTLSCDVEVSVTASGHTETWTYKDKEEKTTSAEFVFYNGDGNGRISQPNNRDSNNIYRSNLTPGIYSSELGNLLFRTGNSFNPEDGSGIIGKQYLGTGDHLFQYGDDPADENNYGYYYFDSMYNAAAYNRSAGRFYVYDYLERTSASQNDGRFSDFLPLNSPYANTNGTSPNTYSYAGINGEYSGTTHYAYDSSNNANGYTSVDYWFGMSAEIDFFLPNTPGTKDADGHYANTSLHGDNMIFDFSGDDDVWVFVDGKLVLDIGGIHDIRGGSINFSTGVVEAQGETTGSVTYLEPGQHTLTMYYLERGAGGSNNKVRFNISPRYALSLQKEDVLTRHLLNGAQFSVFTDEACTSPAKLWTSEAEYISYGDDAAVNTFTVVDGKADMWGLAAGSTYYIKETQSPEGYEMTYGIIRMELNNIGIASYTVLPDPNAPSDADQLTGGFTVHGYKVDLEAQAAFLVITNGKNVDETTSIEVRKVWNDELDHSADDPITVYLMVNGQRIREESLSEANNWRFVWENMPKHYEDGTTEVIYSVQEGTVPGYVNRIEQVTDFGSVAVSWKQVGSFEHGEIYLLKTSNGYLATDSNGLFCWVEDEASAIANKGARWVAGVSGSTVYLTNEAGYAINYYSSGNTRNFRASNNASGLGFNNGRLYYRSGNRTYYMGSLNNNGRAAATTNANSALSFTPYVRSAVSITEPVTGVGFEIINTPVGEEETISLTVVKAWELGSLGATTNYQELSIDVQLMENGEPSGMTAELSLRNGWTHSFTGLPKFDAYGKEISYSVLEEWASPGWNTVYGEILAVDGSDSAYITTITNISTLIYMLPETGGTGTLPYTAGGLLLIAAAGFLLLYNHRRDRRREGK